MYTSLASARSRSRSSTVPSSCAAGRFSGVRSRTPSGTQASTSDSSVAWPTALSISAVSSARGPMCRAAKEPAGLRELKGGSDPASGGRGSEPSTISRTLPARGAMPAGPRGSRRVGPAGSRAGATDPLSAAGVRLLAAVRSGGPQRHRSHRGAGPPAQGELVVGGGDRTAVDSLGRQFGELTGQLPQRAGDGDAEDALTAGEQVDDLLGRGALVDGRTVGEQRDVGEVLDAAVAEVVDGLADVLQRDAGVQ